VQNVNQLASQLCPASFFHAPMANNAMVWDCLHSASLRFGSPTSRRYT